MSSTDWAGRFLDLALAFAAEQTNVDERSKAIAELFCAMTDDGQAQFFTHVANAMSRWGRPGAASHQAFHIGRHLRTCECSSDGARRFIEEIAGAMALDAS